MSLRIGTSGWSYPTGKGTWNGVFYPATRSKRDGTKDFDELRFYAEHFDTVEVNATFYGQPRADVTRHWVERTPDRFEFSVKLYQKFTHPGMFRRTLTDTLGDAHADSQTLDALATPNDADLDAFRRGIDPLADHGRLGALLAQFPPSFKRGETERRYLEGLLASFRAYPVAVELRHKSWSDHVGKTVALLNEFDAAWVQIDEPKFRFSIRQNFLPNVRGFYYMRLHGRNADAWWKHEKSEDRYNYLYSPEELKAFTETAAAASDIVKKVYLYTNNHFSAKSVANAVMIKRQLNEPIEGEYSDAFVQAYPNLAGVVQVIRALDPTAQEVTKAPRR